MLLFCWHPEDAVELNLVLLPPLLDLPVLELPAGGGTLQEHLDGELDRGRRVVVGPGGFGVVQQLEGFLEHPLEGELLGGEFLDSRTAPAAVGGNVVEVVDLGAHELYFLFHQVALFLHRLAIVGVVLVDLLPQPPHLPSLGPAGRS